MRSYGRADGCARVGDQLASFLESGGLREGAAKEQSLGLDFALFLISYCPQGSLGPPGYKPGPHLSGNLVDADIRKRNLSRLAQPAPRMLHGLHGNAEQREAHHPWV